MTIPIHPASPRLAAEPHPRQEHTNIEYQLPTVVAQNTDDKPSQVELLGAFCKRILASIPLEKIALLPLLLTDLSLLSIGTTVALMLLRSLTANGKGESLFYVPSSAILPATEALER